MTEATTTLTRAETERGGLTRKNDFRPEVEGLRAFAVLSVIVNHFSKSAMPGGFLGVDIFFVISGYVITSSLFRKSEMGIFHFLADFYARRVRRLIPALAVCVLITGMAVILFDPDPETSVETGVYALFGFSNIHFYLMASDYYGPEAALNAFAQTWSLGVEEQFYLLFPLLLWLLTAGQVGRGGAGDWCRHLLVFAAFLGFFCVSLRKKSAGRFFSLAHPRMGAWHWLPVVSWYTGRIV
jgi:peptidoglycan/LPS O-acetylase OafA/YrhL